MFHLGKIGFVTSCKTPEGSKWMALSSSSSYGLGYKGQDSPEFLAVMAQVPKGKQDTASESKELLARDSELGTLHRTFPECAGLIIMTMAYGLHVRTESRETQSHQHSGPSPGAAQWPRPRASDPPHLMAFHTDGVW